ncbi:pentatricopeptide repeat-containing protein At1g14470-like [Nymphaea colorata]|uniref:pentatricopeptide repeat-containing protein At1g14470-like n=1 Tax=Nymphaea colorata TaxID=210225 RepID=UPI00129EF0E8|nr:pentatricopeptide repeat-containing protein At1g14470-like [Nymphaea colorata]
MVRLQPLTPSSLVAPAAWCKHPRHLKQIHAFLFRHGLHHTNLWLATLISLCSRLTLPRYARRVFDSVPHPDVLVYTAMIKLHAGAGPQAYADAVAFYLAMQRTGHVRPDSFVFPALLKSVSSVPDISLGKAIHAQILRFGHQSDPYVQNAVMNMYAKCGEILLAHQLFEKLPEKALADWNSMVSAYCRLGDLTAARRLFKLMPRTNEVSWTTMVSGYAKSGDLETARELFDQMPERNVVSWNAMLSAYAHEDRDEEALGLFKKMLGTTIRPDETTLVTVISVCAKRADPELAGWLVRLLEGNEIALNCFVRTAMLDMYAKCGCLEAARRIFDCMQERNSVSWNAMIAGYAKNGDVDTAKELFDKMPEKNVVSWNSMIAGYAQNGHCEAAIKLFKEMTTVKVLKPDEVTMASVFAACGHLGILDLANWAQNYVKINKVKLCISGYNAMIHMCARCGSMEESRKVFEEMSVKDVISYNALIAGFAAHGQAPEALRLLSTMQEVGVEPDRITFIGVLTACSHAGLVDEGRRVFESIKTPSVDHYACLVDLLGRAGRLEEAQKLIKEMPFEPHAGIYGALLNACRTHKAVKLGEFVAGKLFILEPNNSGNYVLLSNIYADAKRWDDVEKVRQMMRNNGMQKTTACSWVECGGKVHRFIVGDQSHPQSAEIYMLLGELTNKMRSLGYEPDKNWSLRDVEDEEKGELMGVHSERLAIAFGLIVCSPGSSAPIRVVKNLRVCGDCHVAIKIISKIVRREIIVRDNTRFHHFKDGDCSCMDYW